MSEKNTTPVLNTINAISRIGSIVLAIMALIGVIVYQTQSNTSLELKVQNLGVQVQSGFEEIKKDTKDDRKYFTDTLKNQDEKIQKQQEEIVELKVKVKILEDAKKRGE